MQRIRAIFIRCVLCVVLSIVVLPLCAEAKNLEPMITSAEWGHTSSSFTVRFYEAGEQPYILSAVYVNGQMYGTAMLESNGNFEYVGSVVHKPLTDEMQATVKLFFVEEESYAPIRMAYQEERLAETGPKEEGAPLVVACEPFGQIYSPFYAETDIDERVNSMTQVSLLSCDREGAMVLNGIPGETRDYNGTEYMYHGIADCALTKHEDGTVDYDITLRDDIRFSDGVPLTADDVIFSMYVLADPAYAGPFSFCDLPIEGMEEYRDNMHILMDLLLEAGRENQNFRFWDEAIQAAFWADLDQAGARFCQEIVNLYNEHGWDINVAGAAEQWGYPGLPEDATTADFFAELLAVYGTDLKTLSETETAGSSLFSFMERYEDWMKGAATGENVTSIVGIQKTGEYALRISMSKFDVRGTYLLGIPVAPLHHYGDLTLYDYENGQFGFPKGDLTSIYARNREPLGAGPYICKEMDDGAIFFEANPRYFKGEPEIQAVCFRKYGEEDAVRGVAKGTFHIFEPEFDANGAAAIQTCNSNEQLTGNTLTTVTTNVPMNGYIGINADTVRVGMESDSEESKLLRKALATVLAVHREPAIEEYFGECAYVIEYPISSSSWAAPKPGETGYRPAYSRDLYGDTIVTPDQSQTQKVEAVKRAVSAMLLSIGYMQDENGRFFAEQENGYPTSWRVIVSGDGVGDQPCCGVFARAKATLQELGLDLEIVDVEDGELLWEALDDGSAQLWAAAWSEPAEPNLYQVYHSSNIAGVQGSSGFNHCRIRDPELDELLLHACSTTDRMARKALYKQCLDIILDWGVVVPVYQRLECVIFSNGQIDTDTLVPDQTPYYGWMEEIHKLKLRSGS